jgi:DNA-binding MarR family transcriptional regulator
MIHETEHPDHTYPERDAHPKCDAYPEHDAHPKCDAHPECDAGPEQICPEHESCPEPEQLDSMGFWVVRLMHRYGSIHYKIFQELGIHPGQLPVIATLNKKEGLSMRELADELHIKPPTVTVTIQRLEKNGVVCKQTDAKDQRISRLYLTEKGKNLDKKIQAMAQTSEQILTAGFTEAEQEQMKQYFRRMVNNLVEASGRDWKDSTKDKAEQ